MKELFTTKQKEIITQLNWGITENNEGYELSKYSPAGEDYSFSIDTTINTPLEEIIDYVDNFDIDEHVSLFVDARGTRGIPSSIRTLVEDAEAIQEMLDELKEALYDAEN